MAATVTELGARVLRRLGVAAVAASDRPSITATSTVTDIAARALSTLGVVVPASERPALAANVTVADVAARALQRLAVSVPEVDRPVNATTTNALDIANLALANLGVTVPIGEWPVVSGLASVAAIATDALQRLGVVAADEAGTAEDNALAQNRVRAVHERMVLNGLADWAETAIPRGWQDTYAALAAIQLAPAFGKQVDTARQAQLEQQLRSGQAAGRGSTVGIFRVNSIHAELVAVGAASWAVDAIPRAVAEDYEMIVRTSLAPMFGVELPPVDRAAFEARVRRVALTMRAQSDAVATVTAVHDSLARRGLASWATSAIPAGVREPLSGLVATELASGFGIAADRGVVGEFEAQVGRVAQIIRSQAQAEATVNAVHERLVARGLVSWAGTAIPRSVSEEYVAIARMDLAPAFALQGDPAAAEAAEERIRRVSLLIGGPALAEKALRAVHADLAARGKTRWTWLDLPEAAEQPYVVLAANHLAYEFQVPPDQIGGARAERDLVRLIALPSSGERVVAEYF